MRTLIRGALIFLCAAGLDQLGTLSAQTSDASIYSALRWRNVGPNRGGRSLTAAGSPNRPNEYYFGAVGGGLWKTTDGGTTWAAVTDGQIRSSSVGAVAVAESNPDLVYLGMGEACLRGNIMQGDGIYKSTDGGRTWAHMGLRDSHAVAKIRVHPTNPDIVYAAVLGHPYAAHPERGIFRSRDGGRTWQKILFKSDSAGAVDLVIDRTNPNVLYAALWHVYRTPWKLWSGGTFSGLFKSTDGGDTWTELTRKPGMPEGIIGKIGVAVSPADPSRVFALVEANEGGLFVSNDAGATWSRVSDDRRLRQRAFYYTHVYADPKDRETVYVLNTGFYQSTDGGKTYSTIRVPHGDNHDLWIDPTNPLRMANANDGGGNVSINGGETWTEQDYATAQLYHVTTTTDFPYHVCGAQQDNSTVCVPSSGWNNMQARGPNHGWYYDAGGGESGYIDGHPGNPDIFYAGSQGALVTRYDRSTGHIRDIQVYPRFFSGEPSSALPDRWQWTFPIVISPHHPNVLYVTSQHVWKSSNDGQSWTRISPDLTRADPRTLGPTGGPITSDMNGPEVYATVYALAPSLHDSNTIWAGSDDGLMHLTRDGGKTWKNVTPPDIPEFTGISMVDASSHNPGGAYVAGKRYQLDDRAPYIWKTADYGTTWTRIVGGIRADDYVHVVREDTRRAGLLYAGTEHGAYVSFDDGASWQSLSLNLMDTQVSDLVVEANDLAIATHGRSLWVLPDIEPLRQLTPEVARAEVYLFRPREAVRGALTANLQYYLRRAADTVKVEILDAQGAVVRSFTGTAADDRRDEPEQGGFGGPPQRPPTARAELNQFTWDLRYPGATTFDGIIIWSAQPARGPLAPPGRYQVRLTALGTTQTQPLAIAKDPRFTHITQADLEEQFRLAMRIRDQESAANEAVIRIREAKKQIQDRVQRANTNDVRRAAKNVSRALSAVEEELYQVRNRSNQDPLNFPIKLNNRLSSLRRSVETGEARPTDGAYKVLEELSAELDRHLATLNTVMTRDLARLNEVLARRNLEPVRVGEPQ